MHGKESRPQKIKICALDTDLLSQKFFCPFELIGWYLELRGNYDDGNEPFLVFADYSPVSPVQFRGML